MPTDVQTVERLYTCREIAALTGRAPHTVKTLASRYATTDHPIGRKIGRDWVFTETDLSRIREIPAVAGRPSGWHSGTTRGLHRPRRAAATATAEE